MARDERFGTMTSNRFGKCRSCGVMIDTGETCFYDNWRNIRICKSCKQRAENEEAQGGDVKVTKVMGLDPSLVNRFERIEKKLDAVLKLCEPLQKLKGE